MQPVLVPLSEVDFDAWDACVAASGTALPYGYTDWLMAVAGPYVQGLVWPSESGYAAVLPLPTKRKWGLVPYVAMPPLTQRLGLYAQAGQALPALAAQARWVLTTKFLRVHLALEQKDVAQALGRLPLQQKNLVLDVGQGLAALEAGLGKSIRQKLKQAQAASIFIEPVPTETAIHFIESALASKPEVWPRANSQVAAALASISAMGLAGAKFRLYAEMAYAGQMPVAAALWVGCGSRTIYLAGASTALGLQQGAMASLLWQKIASLAGQPSRAGNNFVLDFEGGNMGGTSQFFSMFGAQPEAYWGVHLGL